MELAPGTVVCSRYEIVRPLGSGGSGSVFAATNLTVGRPFALKLLPTGGGREGLVRREALAGAIKSRNVVEIYDVQTDGHLQALVIVMELLEGNHVGNLVAQQGRFSAPETATVLRDVLSGISAAHGRGIVHGDLKPSNVFCVSRPTEERSVVLDFGIASLARSDEDSLTTNLGGTPLWMDPTAVHGRIRTWSSDTWAIGLLGYYMLVGRTYWEETETAPLLREILTGAKPLASARAETHGALIPSWFDAFFDACVNSESERLKKPEVLLELIPDLPRQSPVHHQGHKAASDGSTAANLAELAPTELFAATPDTRAERLEPPVVPTTPLARMLPQPLHKHAASIARFVEWLFGSHEVLEHIVALKAPKVSFAKAYEFFFLALASDNASSLRTITFVDYTKGLEATLQTLDRESLKVVIVVVDTTELGLGVRVRIAELFRSYRAALIPIYIEDLFGLRSPDDARAWLEKRWQANRPVTNPFEPKVLDQTLLPAYAPLVNLLVQELVQHAELLALYGAPGAGKSSLMRMTATELRQDCDVYWLSLGGLPSGAYVREFMRRAGVAFEVPVEQHEGRFTDAFSIGVAKALSVARERGIRPVIVIDDADPLIDPSRLPHNEEDRQFLGDLRQVVADVLRGRDISLVVVGLRVFTAAHAELSGAPNPLQKFVRLLKVPALSITEVAAICNLGRQVDLHFKDEAVARVHDWSSGNVHVTQMICGRLLESKGVGAAREVTKDDVDGVAKELIVTRQAFDRRIMPWLTTTEKSVLATVARGSFESPLELMGLLPGVDEAHLGDALDSLVEMGLLERPQGKTRVRGKLLAAWVTTHMLLPEGAELRRRRRRLRAASAGVMATALLYGAGVLAFRAGEQSAVIAAGECATTAVAPERVVDGEPMFIRIARDCQRPTPGVIEVLPAGDSYARFVVDDGPRADGFRLEAVSGSARTQGRAEVVDRNPGKKGQVFQINADDQSTTLVVGENWLGGLSEAVRALLVAAGAIPALLGLVFAFYSDVRSALDRLLSRDATDQQR